MKLKCVIGSLRLNDGTEYSKGDIFSLDDEKSVQVFLHSRYVQEEVEQKRKETIEEPEEISVPPVSKGKKKSKYHRGK